MRLIANTGNDRVLDQLQKTFPEASQFDVASPEFSLFAFSSTRELLQKLTQCRLVLPLSGNGDVHVLGGDCDRAFRNQLKNRALARDCARWLKEKVRLRFVPNSLPQSMLIARNTASGESNVISGNCPFSTNGLGLTPGNQFSLIQSSESLTEGKMLETWFSGLWDSLSSGKTGQNWLADHLDEMVAQTC